MAVPKYRFPEFSGEWKKCTAGDILTERVSKQQITETEPLLAFAAGQGVIDRSERKTNNRDFLTNDMENKIYLLTEYNDIVYNPANLKYGAIDRNTHGRGVISPIYVTFTTKEVPKFVELLVKSYNFKQAALQYEEGSVVKLKAVKPDDFVKVEIQIPPTREEQQKIADMFDTIDNRIAIQISIIEKLKQKRANIIRQIFSKEIRFKQSNGTAYPNWSVVTLETIGSFYGGLSGKTKDDFGHGESKFITYMNINKNPFTNNSILEPVDVDEAENQNHVKYGDILFTQSSETMEEAGITSVYLYNDEPYLNSFSMGFSLKDQTKTVPEYMGYVMRTFEVRKQIIKEAQGVSRINLASSRILGTQIPMPCPEEQIKIAQFLRTFDKKIEVEESILHTLEELRHGLVQQMLL